MADPVVHITNGVPDLGTGNITTLGQVLSAIQSLAGALFAKVTDGTNTASVKAASTAPIATDPALVVSISPNSSGIITTGTAGSPSATVLSVQGVSNGTTIPVSNTPTPTTSGGLSSSSTLITTANGVLNVKASAGSVKKLEVSNSDSVGYWFKFTNITTTPVAGTSAVFRRLWIPAGAVALISYEYGLDFSTGIGYSLTSGAADNNTGAVTSSTVAVNIDYK